MREIYLLTQGKKQKKPTKDYIEIHTEMIQSLYRIVMEDCCLHLPPP